MEWLNTVTNLHSEEGIMGIAEWGTNHFGNAFTTEITQPLVFKQDSIFRPDSGKEWHTTAIP